MVRVAAQALVPEPRSVAGSVIGDDPFTANTDVGEPGFGAGPELCCGGGLFVVKDLGVGQSGAVIDGGVDIAVADATLAVMRIVIPSSFLQFY